MAIVLRMGALVIVLELAAVGVAYGYFGLPILVFGVPALLATFLVLVFVRVSEKPRQVLQEHRAERRFDPEATIPAGGLMSGFFRPAG